MTKEEYVRIIEPKSNKQTIYQFNQLKSFIDESLKEVASKSFENDSEKIKHLLNTVYNVRDFALALTTENSVRLNLLNDIKRLEEEIELGNKLKPQEEKLSQTIVEKSEQDRSE